MCVNVLLMGLKLAVGLVIGTVDKKQLPCGHHFFHTLVEVRVILYQIFQFVSSEFVVQPDILIFLTWTRTSIIPGSRFPWPAKP